MTVRPFAVGFVAALLLGGPAVANARIEIGSSEIRNGAVQNRHIRPGAVESPQVGNRQVKGRHASDGAFGGRAIREGSLNADVLQRRIRDRCPAGQAMVGAATSGSPLCQLFDLDIGPAGGDLTGTYPDPRIADGAIDQLALFAAALRDGPTADPTLRSLGTGAQQAAAGDDARFPTVAEKAALAGTSGSPQGSNPYVTSADPRLLRLPGNNVAAGPGALNSVTTGQSNIAVGGNAATSLTTGANNLASGTDSLSSLTTGSNNLGFGTNSVGLVTTGNNNLGFGINALSSLTAANNNLGFGTNALSSLTTGGSNLALGANSGSSLTTGGLNIAIGNPGEAADSQTIRIGQFQNRAFLAGVRGATTGVNDAVPVLVDSQGQLGTVNSSRRYKTDIAPIDAHRSRALRSLRPVSFRYREHERGDRQFGLIAEQVERVMPELVIRDERGRAETVAYQQLPSLLLGEVKRQDRRLRAQAHELDRLSKRLRAVEKHTR